MPDIRLYTAVIPETDQASRSASNKKRVSSKSSLTTDFGDVQETGSQPGARPIRGVFKGLRADLAAKEVQELAQASNYGAVPLFTDDNNTKNDGYVTVESFDTNPVDPRQSGQNLWQFNGRLREKGTPRSHWRAVKTQPTSISNPFDSGGTDHIGIPSSASPVYWYDEKGQTVEKATVQNTLANKFLNIDEYSPDEPSFSNPTLIYDANLEDEGKMDARVWDDYNASRLDNNNNRQWQKVFATGHHHNGNTVIENGSIKIILDEDNSSLTAERWDGSSYSSVSLGASDWQLSDYNLTRISPTRVEGQIRFENTVNGNLHTLNYQVNRATDDVVWITPPNETTIPSGLSTKLNPIAETWSDEAQPVQKIISRREVNN